MTWDQFLKAIAKAGLSQRKFALASETHLRTVTRWKERVHGIPRWVPMWLEKYHYSAPKKVKRASPCPTRCRG